MNLVNHSTIEFPQLVGGWDIEPAIEALDQCGLSTAFDSDLRNCLLIALSHESYIYEHSREMPGVTPGLLEALNSLGSAFLARTAAVHLYQQMAFDRPGPLSERISHIGSGFPEWAGRLDWLRESAALSKGLDREALPRRVPAKLCRQVLGVLCLARREDVAARLIADLLARSREELERSAADPRTRLQEVLGHTALDTNIQQTGPDHAQSFRATLTDSRGRRSSGEGLSKKQAVRVASAEFLRRYMPDVSVEYRVRIRSDRVRATPLLVAGGRFERHVDAVERFRELFELPAQASALLSQALIHSSWTYEHQDMVAQTHQQDNQVLGLTGSHVLTYEYALRAVSVICGNPPEQFTFLTLDRKPYERAFYHSGLTGALLLGSGQASIGISSEMAANAFQAIMAAIYSGKNCPASLLQDWPPRLSRLRDIVIPEVPRPQDSVTLLQEACAASQLTNDYSAEVSGPTHRQRSRATLILGSRAIGKRIEVIGDSVPGGKSPAKQEVATTVLEALDALALIFHRA